MARFILSRSVLLALLAQSSVNAFTFVPNTSINAAPFTATTSAITSTSTTLFNTESPSDEEIEKTLAKSKLSKEEIDQVGNLVADDEWMGLGMELSELVRTAVIEEAKKNTSDFIGKEDYKVGDITKEIDTRVKVS
jgi:hypothetical protein